MKIVKRIFKWLGISAGVFLVIIIILALLTQTQFFKDRLRIILVSEITSNINGTLHLGTIEGNFLTGFSIDSIVISNGRGVILSSGKITCRYDLLPLLKKKLRVRYFSIHQPTFTLAKSIDGKWNIDELFKPAEDTTTGTFDWTVQIDDFELRRATVRMVDSVSLLDPNHWDMPSSYFEYHNFTINDLTLKMNAFIRPNLIRAQIEHLGCTSPESKFELKNFKTDVTLSEKSITLKNTIIQTKRSFVEIDAMMKDINFFQGIRLEEMEHDSTRLQFRTKNLDLRELRSFLPQVSFLDGLVSATLTAGGEFGNLQITELNMKTRGSTINMSGNIRNLHNPGELFLDIIVNNSIIVPSDVPKLLPGLPIPRFQENQAMNFTTEFVGKPINFKTQTSLHGEISRADLIGEMNLEASPPTYHLSFATRNIDLTKFFDIENFSTNLTTHGTVAGQGFTIDDITTSLEVSIDSSIVQEIPLSGSKISLSATPHHLEGSAYINSLAMKGQVQAFYDHSVGSLPEFGGTVELTSFDLAVVLADSQYGSDFNLQGRFSGTGSNTANINTSIDISLLPSRFQNHELSSENINLVLDQADTNNKRLTIHSQIADAEFTGKFDIIGTNQMIAEYGSSLLRAVKKHAQGDSAITKELSGSLKHRKTQTNPDVNFTYHLNLKDLEPISSFLGDVPFNTQANIMGNARSDHDILGLTCDGTIREFYVGTSEGGILLNEGILSLQLDSLNQIDPLDRLSGKMALGFNSGLLNKKTLGELNLSINYDQLEGKLSGQTTFDSLFQIKFTGDISVQPNTYVVDLDTLRFSAGDYSWKNYQDVQIRLNNDGLRIMHAEMRRNNERFTLSGALYPTQEFDFTAGMKRLDLTSIGYLSGNPALSIRGQGFTGSANLDIRLTGSLTSPRIALLAESENTYFRETKIGKIFGSLEYREKSALIDLTIRENPTDLQPIVTLKGTLPIDLAFIGVNERFPKQNQKLELHSDGFNLGVLDQLLKDVDDLSGILRCNLALTGTPEYPQYNGEISLTDTKFLFVPNNIHYTLASNLKASGNHIDLKTLSIKNDKERGMNGETNVTGSLSIKNFKIDTFDLTARGQFLLMNEATRRTSPSMYGLLFTETDSDGLNLKGTLMKPYLSGKLFIREANLTFPPVKAADVANTNLTLRHRIIDDTSTSTESERKVSRYYAGLDNESETFSDMQFDSPIIDRLRYSISIETRGPTALTMIFTPATGEELYAELDGKANVINEQGTPNIYGEIEVSPQSYYNFFKRFDAKGKLKFVGPWNNPEMDIQATYEGYKQITSEQLTEQPTTTPQQQDGSQTVNDQKVIVTLNISGTRNEPQLGMGMKVQTTADKEPEDWSTKAKGGDVQSDALSFIITGKFRDELTSREQQEFTNVGSSTGSSVASSLLSSIFSDMLKREFPWIRRADVMYRGGSVQEGTSVNVTATAFKGSLRVGGKIFQDIGNTNVSYQLSLGDFFNVATIRNFYLEIQRKVEGDTPEDKKLTNEARFFYRFSF